MTLEEMKDMKNGRVLRSMVEYLECGAEDEDFDAGYSQEYIEKCGAILDEYINGLLALIGKADNIKEIRSCIESSVQALNALNYDTGECLIETMQREDICGFFYDAAVLAGYPENGDDVTMDWREW